MIGERFPLSFKQDDYSFPRNKRLAVEFSG